MEKGYIRLNRSFFDNEIWQATRAFNESEAWLDLIQSARFEPSVITSRIGSYEVTWGRGEYPASIRFLSRKWGRSERWTRTFLSKLKQRGMIDTRDGGGVSIIRLLNYDKYNGDTLNDTPISFNNNDLQAQVTHLTTQLDELARKIAEERHTVDTNTNKGEEREKKKKIISKDITKEKENVFSHLGFDLSFIDREEYSGIMRQWLDYKREIKKQYKSDKSVKVCYDRLVKLSGGDPDIAAAIVEQSIGNNYQGLFPLKSVARPFAPGSLRDRQKALWNEIIGCGVQCPADTQKAFYAKWSETDASGRWMKCELENGFDVKRRLERYVINSDRQWR